MARIKEDFSLLVYCVLVTILRGQMTLHIVRALRKLYGKDSTDLTDGRYLARREFTVFLQMTFFRAVLVTAGF